MRRRTFLWSSLATAASLPALSGKAPLSPSQAVEQAHAEIWRRFMDEYEVMLDFATLDGSVILPTPEECRQGKPNALGWWSPIENGGMFNGHYMESQTLRWAVTKSQDAADKARRLMKGLLLLNAISPVKGFVGRGVSTDGVSHYPMGSNDQTFPWFYGLWRYYISGIATEEEKLTLLDRLKTTAEVIVAMKWQIPAEPPFGIRGSFAGFTFEHAPRLLFVCRMMASLTGDAIWEQRYQSAVHEKAPDNTGPSRIEACEAGMHHATRFNHNWTECGGVCGLRGLWELETDPALKARYAAGLQRSADAAMLSIPLAKEWDNADTSYFEHNWRIMNELWAPQQTEHDAQKIAHEQIRLFIKHSPRRPKETKCVREPSFAAWIVSLAPDSEILRSRRAALEQVITAYDYSKLIYSQFFPVESAWWRLQTLG